MIQLDRRRITVLELLEGLEGRIDQLDIEKLDVEKCWVSARQGRLGRPVAVQHRHTPVSRGLAVRSMS